MWVNNKKLLGWSSESHTPAGLRQLIHNNLKNWKCKKMSQHNRGWASPKSAGEFRALAGRVPKPVHVANVRAVTELLGEILANVTQIGVNRTQVRKRIREEELECYARGFKALRTNAVGISRRAAEAMRQKILHLRAHLELLSQLGREHPDVYIYLSDGWENRTPQDEMGRMPRKGLGYLIKVAKVREAEILQELERALADIE